ncbi:hypothetical protein PF005_g23404 [Phytophthora fragariae]|uniref:RxLR effector protein n=1 Tax=Phytophthora fragariae TaxID=53985 RepID=A0A6A3W8A8_9STRA|nr:hypothetical protein PF009_g2196 [Phytophthora fragariae]KAE9086044.1 hypothetical protein PF010_g20232 [Phytophthora fragariae]KAE9114642.1 hypothetical protein PF006_g19465 [Phytophthora fragariae]KAE9137393.1 hypothetical protein PF007_g1804 [Phytophthora fragariae]KAE9180155.1 hypothetical protein PF005_g23404 [Phytophthora fragariae]
MTPSYVLLLALLAALNSATIIASCCTAVVSVATEAAEAGRSAAFPLVLASACSGSSASPTS